MFLFFTWDVTVEIELNRLIHFIYKSSNLTFCSICMWFDLNDCKHLSLFWMHIVLNILLIHRFYVTNNVIIFVSNENAN